eukprot:764203-Hanusia_phi.AAC.4
MAAPVMPASINPSWHRGIKGPEGCTAAARLQVCLLADTGVPAATLRVRGTRASDGQDRCPGNDKGLFYFPHSYILCQ